MLLQPECNFLHGFFRYKLLIEVVNVEVKITSIQRTHIFRRDWTMQVIKCTPWSTRLCPHPTIIKKMKTFLEVERKMGPVPTATSQFRSSLPNTKPNIRKDNATERRKRSASKRFRLVAPKPTATHPPLPRPHLNPRMMYQTTDHSQFVRAPHGLAQATCQGTCLKIGTGYSHQII